MTPRLTINSKHQIALPFTRIYHKPNNNENVIAWTTRDLNIIVLDIAVSCICCVRKSSTLKK